MEIMQYSIYNSSDLGASDGHFFLFDLGDVGQVHTNHQVYLTGCIVLHPKRMALLEGSSCIFRLVTVIYFDNFD